MNARTPEVVEFWRAFASASGIAHDDYDVIAFGDGAEMADRLAELVLSGTKRATAGLLRDFTAGGEAMPRKDEHVVLIDGNGRPRCVWRTTEVSVRPFIEVDIQFAFDEGEDDRTLEDWRVGHSRYFKRQGERQGFVFDESAEIVMERFTVVWPPEAAD